MTPPNPVGAVTERPWRADRDDNGFYFIVAQGPYPSPYIVATGGEGETDEANAAFIIRACNAFDEMKAALEGALDALIWCSGSPDFNEGGIAREGWIKGPKQVIAQLDAALALATGATP